MRIAYDHQAFTIQPYGGISRYYTFLAKELSAQKQDIAIFANLHRNHYLAELKKDIIKGRHLENYPPKTGHVFNWLNHALNQLRFAHWQPDIIHETYYSALPVRKTKATRITTVYDMIHELYAANFPTRDKTSHWKKSTFARVDHIISISASTKRDLVDLFDIEEKKISVVHLGVDATSFQKIDASFDNQGKPYLLYVGSRGGYKNFKGLLQAIASSNRLKSDFDILAFGGGSFNTEELEFIANVGFSLSQVRQISGTDAKLAQLYRGACAFIYPSLYEGFGLPPLEAMAAGCPVISSNTSSMPEVIKNAGAYFNPNDIDEIRHTIETVVYSNDTRTRLLAQGYENIKDFSWEKCASETLKIYRHLTGKT